MLLYLYNCSSTYSQGDVALFGSNAGQQCIARSLCALIYNHTNTDLIRWP